MNWAVLVLIKHHAEWKVRLYITLLLDQKAVFLVILSTLIKKRFYLKEKLPSRPRKELKLTQLSAN